MQWPGDAAGYAGCESNGLPGCGLPNWVAEQPVKHKEQRWCTSKTTFSVIFKVQFHLSGPVLHTPSGSLVNAFQVPAKVFSVPGTFRWSTCELWCVLTIAHSV